jgi:hypothetical protein
MTGQGVWRIIVGVLVGAFIGFFVSATAAAIFFLLAEIAANTRRTIDLLQQYNPTPGQPLLPPVIPSVHPSAIRPGRGSTFGSPENTEGVRSGSAVAGSRGNDAGREGLAAVAAATSISPSATTATELNRIAQPEPAPNPESSAGQRASDKWAALIRYDPDLASAHKRVAPLGKKWTNELARKYLQAGNKDSLSQIVEQIIQSGIQEVLHSAMPTYAKWLLLITYDKELAAAHETVVTAFPYQRVWIERLANDYLAIGDKRFLASIVATVSNNAKHDEERRLSQRKGDWSLFVTLICVVVVVAILVTVAYFVRPI